MCLDNVTLPAWPGTRNRLGLRHHGLIPVHLEKCLFLLSLPFLCVAYSCAVVDKKDHTTGAIQQKSLSARHKINRVSLYSNFVVDPDLVGSGFDQIGCSGFRSESDLLTKKSMQCMKLFTLKWSISCIVDYKHISFIRSL